MPPAAQLRPLETAAARPRHERCAKSACDMPVPLLRGSEAERRSARTRPAVRLPMKEPHDAGPRTRRRHRRSNRHDYQDHPNDKGNPSGKLADAELHFTDGPRKGLKLIGFSVRERRVGNGRNVIFSARQYQVNSERSHCCARSLTRQPRIAFANSCWTRAPSTKSARRSLRTGVVRAGALGPVRRSGLLACARQRRQRDTQSRSALMRVD